MGTAADDARDTEEFWEELKWLHNRGECDLDCPYCNDDFEPLFSFQVNEIEHTASADAESTPLS